MTKPQKIKNNKIEDKKTITPMTVIRAIIITLVCSILLLGIVARIVHYFDIHWK